MPYKFRPAGDLATEVEWARNRRLTPDNYMDSLGSHEPPIPADLMQRVFAAYENEVVPRSGEFEVAALRLIPATPW